MMRWEKLAGMYAGPVPTAYILALIAAESGGDPDNINPTSHATGLLQITATALAGWNERNGEALSLDDLRDPELNVKVGCDLLRRIVASYAKNHPRTLATDWDSPRFVELVTLGWNAGWSESAGVGYVVGQLEQRGIAPERITADTVSQASAALPNASRYLKVPGRLAWAKKVAASFLGDKYTPEPKSRVGLYVGIGVVVVGGYLVWRHLDKKREIEERRERKRLKKAEPDAAPPVPRIVQIQLPTGGL